MISKQIQNLQRNKELYSTSTETENTLIKNSDDDENLYNKIMRINDEVDNKLLQNLDLEETKYLYEDQIQKENIIQNDGDNINLNKEVLFII